jgi:hypothetical protein
MDHALVCHGAAKEAAVLDQHALAERLHRKFEIVDIEILHVAHGLIERRNAARQPVFKR